MKNSKLLLLLLVVILAGGAAYLVLRKPEPAPRRPAAPVEKSVVETPAPALPSSPELPASSDEPREAIVEIEEPEPVPVHGEENFDLAGARWIRGHVTAPAGSPPDLTLEVIAVAIAAGEVLTEGERPLSGDRSILQALEQDGRAVSRRSVSLGLGAGAFELPVPSNADRAALFVDGHYLHLREAKIVTLSEVDDLSPPIELEAELGSFLKVLVFPPEGVSDGEIAGTHVVLKGFLDEEMAFQGFSGASKRREASWVPGEPIEWPALSEGLRVVASASHPEFLDGFKVVTRLIGAKDQAIELHLEAGQALKGRVTDEESLGIADAKVRIHITAADPVKRNMSELFFDLQSEPIEVLTGPDGSFEVHGLDEGTASLRISKGGWTRASLKDVQVPHEDPLEIQLTRGKRLAGQVQWPDGSPAVGARVAVRSGWGGVMGFGESNLQGRFLISGLDEGALFVHAELDRRLKDGGAIDEDLPPTLASRLHGSGPSATSDNFVPDDFKDEERMSATLWRVTAGPVPPEEEALLTLEEPCTLRGRVIDGLGSPVPSFRILCEAGGSMEWPLARPNLEKEFAASSTGEFVIEGLSKGDWKITPLSDEHLPSEEPKFVSLPTDERIDLKLLEGLTAHGIVRDPFGNPVEGARVLAPPSGKNRSNARYGLGHFTESKADGSFRLPALSPGNYDLFAEHDNWATGAPYLLELAEEADPVEIELILTVGGTLDGMIYDREGNPDPDRPIQVFSMDSGSSEVTVSDSAGRFSMTALTPGNYQVVSEPTTDELEAVMTEDDFEPGPSAIARVVRMASVEIREGESSSVVLGEPPTEPIRVFGRVSRGGAPIGSGFLVAIPEGKDLLKALRPTKVDEKGQYELTVDEPGELMLRYQGADDLREGFPLHVRLPAGVAQFELDIDLPLSGITGVVRGLSGDPVQGVRVRLATSSGTYGALAAIESGPSTLTDREGRYLFESVPPREDYVVRAGGNAIFGLEQRSDLIVREDTMLEDIDFELGRSGRILGTVVDGQGEAVRGASIFVRDERGRPLEALSEIVSDATGQFKVDGIAGVATYTVFARTSAQLSLESAVAVVRPGEDSKVTLALGPGTLLRVALKDRKGDPIRANLSVRDEVGHEHASLLGVEARSRFMLEGISSSDLTIGPLAPGKYWLVARTPGGEEQKKSISLNGQDERRVKLRFEQ